MAIHSQSTESGNPGQDPFIGTLHLEARANQLPGSGIDATAYREAGETGGSDVPLILAPREADTSPADSRPHLVAVADPPDPDQGKRNLYQAALAGDYGGEPQNGSDARRKLPGWRKVVGTAGAITVAAVAGVLMSKGEDSRVVEEPTVLLGSHVVNEGDAAGMTKVAQDMINDSDGRITLPAEALLPYMHTEYNPEGGGGQDPSDHKLQLGERVKLEATEDDAQKIIGIPAP